MYVYILCIYYILYIANSLILIGEQRLLFTLNIMRNKRNLSKLIDLKLRSNQPSVLIVTCFGEDCKKIWETIFTIKIKVCIMYQPEFTI